jgi:protein-S-isoprenylcysteine O-methyltransferase Ste14
MAVKTTPSVVIRLLLWVLLLAGGTGVGIWLDLRWFRELFFSPLWHLLTLPVGLVLMKLAFHAAAAGGRELARQGKSSADVPRLETDRLVTSGIYAHMRHPMLFGLTLVPLALAFIVGSPAYITLVAPVEMLFIVIMVLTFEERECRKKFGTEYDAYARRVPPVCFTPECLKMLFIR